MSRPYWTAEHERFREVLRAFLDREARPYYDTWEAEREVPRSFWQSLGKQGYLCPEVPPEYGGAGADFGYAVAIIEELERVGSGLAGISLHNDIVVPYLLAYATEEQKRRWLPGCVTGETITAVAMTEPGAGSDLAGIRTVARRAGEHYVVNGQKTFITNGILADLVVVVVRTDPDAEPHRGLSLLVVERGTPGFTRGRKLRKIGQHSQDTAELFFSDARVPVGNLLGREGQGFRYLMERLVQERLVVAIGAQVAAEVMLEDTLAYVKTRTAFGRPIGAFQHVAFTLAEVATEVRLGRTFVDDLIGRYMAGDDLVTEVSMAKWWVTDMAKRVASRCLQLHGGYGYMEEFPIARRYRDVAVTSIYAGTNEIMKTIIARRMGLGER
jgi:acyl-CoA dehydrogenase